MRQETRHWNETDGRTHTLRTKEDADDYRYFLEPDLVPLAPEAEWVEQVRAALPMLPAARRARLAEATGADVQGEAVAVVVERGQDDYVLAVGDERRRRRPCARAREGGVRRPGRRRRPCRPPTSPSSRRWRRAGS